MAAATTSCSLPAETLFSKDGISLSATPLSPNSNANASNISSNEGDDDDHDNDNGIILTLTLHRIHEKNVINPTMISLLIQALDVIDSHPTLVHTNNKSLIITGLSSTDPHGTTHKFFSNGLDLEWMLRAADEKSSDAGTNPTSKVIESFNSLVLARVLTLPFRTIAAINGHCIGAGLFLALACDYRIMRTKRGFLQWPEARLGVRLTKGPAELSKAKVGNGRGGLGAASPDHHVLREGLLTAKKYTSSEALAMAIVDAEHPIEELYSHAFQMAKEGLPASLNLDYFDPKAYTEMKIEMYTDAYRALKFGKPTEDLPHSRI